jgi:hypothetical protein
MADDMHAGVLIIDQNGGAKAGAAARDLFNFAIHLAKLGARAVLSAEGYDVAKALKVVDGWVEQAAAEHAAALTRQGGPR